jgi:hypothetical protein
MLTDAGKEVMVGQSVEFARKDGIMCASSVLTMVMSPFGMSVCV